MFSITKATSIKKLSKGIRPHERAYFIKNETNIRLCNYINGKLTYIVIPFSDAAAMETAAQVLKACGIIDTYKKVSLNNRFYVELQRYHYNEHADPQGNKMGCIIKQPVEWTALKLTSYDVQQFAAHFAWETATSIIRMHKEAPVVRMQPRFANTKNAA